MPKIKVIGEFNSAACGDCPKQDTCMAFGLVLRLREPLGATAVLATSRFEEAMAILKTEIDEGGRISALEDVEIAVRRAKAMALQSEKIEETITQVITAAVLAQSVPESFVTENDFRHDTLDGILVQYRDELGPETTIEELNQAGNDVRLYTSTNVCMAIDVVEPRLARRIRQQPQE